MQILHGDTPQEQKTDEGLCMWILVFLQLIVFVFMSNMYSLWLWRESLRAAIRVELSENSMFAVGDRKIAAEMTLRVLGKIRK